MLSSNNRTPSDQVTRQDLCLLTFSLVLLLTNGVYRVELSFAEDTKVGISELSSSTLYIPKRKARYLAYQKAHRKDSLREVLIKVNIGLDQPFYTMVDQISRPHRYDVLINTYHRLGSDFKPSDLEKVDSKCSKYSYVTLRRDARIAFEKMCEALIEEGLELYATSGYRSYQTQARIYQKREQKRYTAKAGHSEHQTGLAVDVIPTKEGRFDDVRHSAVYQWYLNHAHEYGFIVRYPYGAERITGFPGESWHLRYLGVKLANAVYKSKLVYDVYHATYIMPSQKAQATEDTRQDL